MIIETEIIKRNLPEIIAEKLETAILQNINSNERKLPSELELVSTFGVSRPVVREALMILKAHGLLSQPNGGRPRITIPSDDVVQQSLRRMMIMRKINPRHIFEVRCCIESTAIRSAAQSNNQKAINLLISCNQKMVNAKKDLKRRALLDRQFHQQIVEISENPLLSLLLNALNEQLAPFIEAGIRAVYLRNQSFNKSDLDHAQLIKAIVDQDPDLAERLMKEHLMESLKNVEEYMKSNE